MAKYVTRIEADKKLCPVLLSNGNLMEEGDLEDGRCNQQFLWLLLLHEMVLYRTALH